MLTPHKEKKQREAGKRGKEGKTRDLGSANLILSLTLGHWKSYLALMACHSRGRVATVALCSDIQKRRMQAIQLHWRPGLLFEPFNCHMVDLISRSRAVLIGEDAGAGCAMGGRQSMRRWRTPTFISYTSCLHLVSCDALFIFLHLYTLRSCILQRTTDKPDESACYR